MADKLPSHWYNMEKLDEKPEAENSTEFTDEADDVLYKRYKVTMFQAHQSVLEYEKIVDQLQRESE